MISENQVKKYCREDISLIENYDKAVSDTTQMWHCHHRKESQYSAGELVDIGEYYNRPACELIFLTPNEHHRLHNLGKHLSEETRLKISELNKGENNYWFGKHHSEESKKKMSLRHKGRDTWMKGKHHSAESKKKLSECRIGKHYPKLSEVKKGLHLHWYNNGVKSILAKTCPEGFVPGRIVCNKRS